VTEGKAHEGPRNIREHEIALSGLPWNAPRTAAFVRILRSFAVFAAQDDTRWGQLAGKLLRSPAEGFMKSMFVVLAAVAVMAGCQQKTETTTETTPTGTLETKTTTVTTTVPAVVVDTMATAAAKESVEAAGRNAADATKDAAHATGTALEKAGDKTADAARSAAHGTGTAMEAAGKKIQEKTAPKH
jgi:hypothetical protein